MSERADEWEETDAGYACQWLKKEYRPCGRWRFIWNVAGSSAYAPYAADSSMHRPGVSDPLPDSFAAVLVSDR